jgi:hypothetical protein
MFDIYTVHLQVAWLAFILMSFYFKSPHLPLIGTAFGWLLALLVGDNRLLHAGFGLVVGAALQYVIQSPVWSLVWVRVASVVTIILLLECITVISHIGFDGLLVSYASLLLFAFVHAIAAIILAALLREPRYE